MIKIKNKETFINQDTFQPVVKYFIEYDVPIEAMQDLINTQGMQAYNHFCGKELIEAINEFNNINKV